MGNRSRNCTSVSSTLLINPLNTLCLRIRCYFRLSCKENLRTQPVFRVNGNYNLKNVKVFKIEILLHMKNPSTKCIESIFKGKDVSHYFNTDIGLNVMFNNETKRFLSS